MSISKSQRALVAACYIASNKLDMYRVGQGFGVGLINTLSANYQFSSILVDKDATEKKFLDAIKAMAAKPSVKAVDVLVMLHGRNRKLAFYDKTYSTKDIGTAIKNMGIKKKLRLYYSTACYGVTHNHDMRDAGFDTAVGAKGVNTNGSTEYPIVLPMWAVGAEIVDCIQAGMVGYEISDNIVRSQYPDANSYKEVWGRHHITIGTAPV